ncbi:MAG: hypothetical protein AAGF96_22890 [Bacteroidota bacterium]
MMQSILRIKRESNLGGLLLMLGALIILITIGFEYRIGWIGVKRPASEVPLFIFQKWDRLQVIWGWQCIGFFLQTIAYVLLLKNSSNSFKSLLWSLLALLGLLIVIAFGITLGSYGPALDVYETQPELFHSFRGAVRSLYSPGLLGLVFLTIIYLIDTFSANGVINRKWGLVGFALVLLGIVLSFVPGLPGKTIGAVIFFVPLFVGYAYWLNA